MVSYTLFNLVHNKFCFLVTVILHPRDLVTCCNIYGCNLTKPAVCIFTRHVGEQIPVLQSHVIYCSFGIPNIHLYGHRITRWRLMQSKQPREIVSNMSSRSKEKESRYSCCNNELYDLIVLQSFEECPTTSFSSDMISLSVGINAHDLETQIIFVTNELVWIEATRDLVVSYHTCTNVSTWYSSSTIWNYYKLIEIWQSKPIYYLPLGHISFTLVTRVQII